LLKTKSFFEQVIAKFPDETRPLLGNEEAFTKAFKELASMGWLTANDDGTFSRRYWTMREGRGSIEYRCGAEIGAMLAVVNLQMPRREDGKEALALYKQIVGDQKGYLKKMKDDHIRVIRDHDEDAA